MVDHGEPTLKDLLAWADTACYLAKENGRNRVHVYREDDETTRRLSEMEWANRLRWAVEQDRLLLDYQEIVPLDASPDRCAAPSNCCCACATRKAASCCRARSCRRPSATG